MSMRRFTVLTHFKQLKLFSYFPHNGKRFSDQCCFDYGNAETDGNDDGNATMEALYWGSDITWRARATEKDGNIAKPAPVFSVHYNQSTETVVVGYTAHQAQRVSIAVFNQQGRQVATIISGIKAGGRHEAVWNTKGRPAGVYVANINLDGRLESAVKIVVKK